MLVATGALPNRGRVWGGALPNRTALCGVGGPSVAELRASVSRCAASDNAMDEHGVAGASCFVVVIASAVHAGDTVRADERCKPRIVAPRMSGACPPEET